MVVGIRLHADEVSVDDALVRRLVADQHPTWGDLAVRRISSTGTDHAVFRLGDDLVIRLPRVEWAEQQVARELAWLPALAARLPVDVPVPVAVGEPDHGYPFRWLVSPWVPGHDLLAGLAGGGGDGDWVPLARDLAGFLCSLQAIDADGAPVPGKRGRDLARHDQVVRAGIARLADELDAAQAVTVWEAALAAEPWPGPPVWVHGDLLPGNLLIADGRLSGVIDWSATGAGDPACELMVAWSLPADARAQLRADLDIDIDIDIDIDDATWARARGWVIEQAVAFIPYYEATLPAAVAVTRQRLAAVLNEI